jgi:hypothetical protein
LPLDPTKGGAFGIRLFTHDRSPASPFRLNLEQQRKRAKELQHALRAGDADALRRFRRHHPKGGDISDIETEDFIHGLSGARLVVARELGLPSWPRLKAHILAMRQARNAIANGAPAPDRDAKTLHIRCGSDIQAALKEAGLAGDFLEYSNPLCQGPVVADDDWLKQRAVFLKEAYGATMGRSAAQFLDGLEQAEAGLRSAADEYERVVLWFEHDSYDQLVLARCLAQFAATPPRRLELIAVNRYPGSARFIGLGQLPPEALRLLFNERQPVSERQRLAGQSVWTMLRSPDPTPLAAAASAGIPELPYLAAALRRHCQELPWVGDGLGLTERLVLQLLAERPRTVGEIFRDLMLEREPLPWLGDIMFLSIVESMKRIGRPVFTGEQRLTITGLGRAVLAGDVDWLSLAPPERWLGGVRIPSAPPCWRWNDQDATTTLQ